MRQRHQRLTVGYPKHNQLDIRTSPKHKQNAFRDSRLGNQRLGDHDGQNDQRQNNRQNQQQTTSLAPRILLIPCGTPELHIRRPSIRPDILGIIRDGVKLFSLLTDDLRNLLEQHIQIPHALLDVPDLLFSLYDQGVLEIDLVLWGQTCKFLLLLLL